MDWNALQERICTATKKSFVALRVKIAPEICYAFALYIDSGAMSIAPSANTLNRLSGKIEFELDEEDKTPENKSYFKWVSSEWAYEAFGGEFFEAINEELRRNEARGEFAHFRNALLLSMTNALRTLADESFFQKHGAVSDDFVLFVTIVDDDSAEDVENESAAVINDPVVYERFVARFGVDE